MAACGGGGGGGPIEGEGTICNGNLCISIAANPELADVGGALVFLVPLHRVYVVRTSANEFSAVTAICTHSQCNIEWKDTIFECPCHGSRFNADGTVSRGPASRALRVYTHMLDGDTLTVVLT